MWQYLKKLTLFYVKLAFETLKSTKQCLLRSEKNLVEGLFFNSQLIQSYFFWQPRDSPPAGHQKECRFISLLRLITPSYTVVSMYFNRCITMCTFSSGKHLKCSWLFHLKLYISVVWSLQCLSITILFWKHTQDFSCSQPQSICMHANITSYVLHINR